MATINVDGRHAKTYVVPFGGVRVSRARGDAIGVRAVSFGLWRLGPSAGVGIVSGRLVEADPRSCGVALLDGPPDADLARVSDLTRTLCLHERRTPDETPLPSAGADRP